MTLINGFVNTQGAQRPNFVHRYCSRESSIWTILKTILCLVLDFQGIGNWGKITLLYRGPITYDKHETPEVFVFHGPLRRSMTARKPRKGLVGIDGFRVFGQMVGVNVFGMGLHLKGHTSNKWWCFREVFLRFNWGKVFFFFLWEWCCCFGCFNWMKGIWGCFARVFCARYPRSRANCESPNRYFWVEFEWKDWCWHSDTSSVNAVYSVSNGIKIKTRK